MHHHYKKRPDRPELTWLFDPVQIRGKLSPYQGPLDVHDYCANYVTALAKLEEAVRLIEGAG